VLRVSQILTHCLPPLRDYLLCTTYITYALFAHTSRTRPYKTDTFLFHAQNDTVVFTAEVLILREQSLLSFRGDGGGETIDLNRGVLNGAGTARLPESSDTQTAKHKTQGGGGDGSKFNPKRLARFIAEFGLEVSIFPNNQIPPA
jgi:hypothetical protein